MKKFILALIVLLIVQVEAFSQTGYPRFETDSLGQKVVLLTIEQAQALDNKTDLLVLLEKLNGQIGEYDSACIKVVNEKEAVIASQTIQINNLKESIVNRDNQLTVQQKNIDGLLVKIASYEKELSNNKTEIDLHIKQIRKSKWRYGIGGGIGGIIVGLVVSILVLH